MKSEVIEEKVKKQEFPKLMESIASGMIVLFISSCEGTVVHEGSDKYQLLHYSTGWIMSAFVDFNGKVILSNK